MGVDLQALGIGAMAELDIPNRYLALAPILVTSPTTRCGTTLVQRMLSASDNGFVYGEEIGYQMRALIGLFLNQIAYFETQAAASDDAFQLALSGQLNDWRPGLTAPSDVMLRAWTDIYYRLPLALAQFGQSIGRPIWGVKWPACPPEMARAVLGLMPQLKVVYVYRNLDNALASAKARRFVTTPDQADAFCAEWAKNMAAFTDLAQTERILLLRYESLIEQPQAAIAVLEAFTRVSGIQESVLDIKVNTFVGDRCNGHSPSQYIEPEPLTEAELAGVRTWGGSMMARHYPDPPPSAPTA